MVSEHASPLAVLGGVDAGGQNVHVASLASALARQGHEVVVHTRRDDAALPGRVEFCPGVVVEHVNAGPPRPIAKDELLPFMDAFADRLRRSWDNERPEIIHSHFWMSGRAALAAARRLAVPVVHTFHALGVVKKRHQGSKDTSPPQRLPTEDRIIKQCDRILATCSDELFELVRLGADRRKISVVPCGVDPDLFKPDGPAWPRRQGLKRVLVVSRLVERKGIGNVISALTEVPKVEAVIAGGPDATRLDTDPMVRNFRALAARLGVDDRVTLLGSVDRNQVPNLIRSSDVVACVPWYEPFGMVALEAMACGVPVVASAVGGLVDTVVDGVTGIHVPPRRPDEVARALNLLLSEARLRKRMGAAGAERARNRYSWDLIAELTAEAYMLVTEREARTAEAWRRR
jgi:glycosyltransferase involved in cell wall biosynthesis